MYGGRNVDNSSFRTMGVGWIFPSRLRRVGGAESSRLSSFVFSLKQDTPSGGDRQHTPRGETHTQQQTEGGSDSTSTHGWAKKRAVYARSAVRFDAERKQKCAIHAKKRAVSERVLALSAVRFGGERMRKWADHAKKRVFCAAMCIGKDA